MTGWFSGAAIDHIAECAVIGNDEGIRSGAALLQRYTELDPRHGLARQLFPDPRSVNLWGPESEIAFQFYCFANLLELAVRTGYVDLSVWDHKEALSEAVAKFVGREAASKTPGDTALTEALSTRLKEKNYRVEKLDTFQFNAFASLLNLESTMRNDSNARDFIEKTQSREWTDDLTFLVTPEHFADTLGRELLEEKKTGIIRGGLAALRYFAWFADILGRVEKSNGLTDAFVRGALWAQQASNVRRRITVWAKRMTEWAPGGYDQEGEFAWQQLCHALFIIEIEVDKLLPRAVGEFVPDIGEDTIESLMAEGRSGAALRLAREAAERCGRSFKETSDKKNAINFIEACQKLAELGDALSAGAIIAPYVNRIHEIEEFWGNEAIKILFIARSEKTVSLSVCPGTY